MFMLFLFLGMKRTLPLGPFSREETSFLKGVAILLIVMHNLYRWVNPVTGENEFHFDASYIWRSWIFLRNDPLEIFHVFFNFLGHYGVQAFIVISAYGLTLSYRKNHPGYGRFILHRLDKLYPSLLLGGFVYILFMLISTGSLISRELLGDLGIQLTLFGNLFPGKAMAISGPWWFYSFIFQFYLLFPLIYWFTGKTGPAGLIGLVVAGYTATIFLYPPMTAANLNPYMMVIGHLPELCLGIYLASRKETRLPVWMLIPAIALLAGGNIWRWLWPFANLGAALIILVIIKALAGLKRRPSGGFALLSAIGGFSMYLFACHGFMRSPFINLANRYESPVLSLAIVVLFVITASGVAILMMKTEQSVRQWISVPGTRKKALLRLAGLLGTTILILSVLFAGDRLWENRKNQVTEAEVYEGYLGFEDQQAGRYDDLTDSIFYEGNRSIRLSGAHAFSPALEFLPDTIDGAEPVRLESGVWLFPAGEKAEIHLVLEIIDHSSGKRMEWKSRFFRPGDYTPGQWFYGNFSFPVPPEYRLPGYRYKLYLWNPGQETWFADGMKVGLLAETKE